MLPSEVVNVSENSPSAVSRAFSVVAD